MAVRKEVLFALVGVAIFIATVGLSLGAHSVTNAGGGTSFNFNEDTYGIINVTVNNTDNSIVANITQVNITMPSTLTMVKFSNATTVPIASNPHSFVNSSTVLSWMNNTMSLFANLSILGNFTYHSFWFNMSASTPGAYNITVTTLNATQAYTTNLTLIVNDTTTPGFVEYVSPTPGNNSYLSSSSINVTTSIVDNGVVGVVIARLFNSTGVQVNSSTNLQTVGALNHSVLFSGHADGIYFFNVSVNDTFTSSENFNSSVLRTVTIDTVVPTVSLSLTRSSTSDFTIAVATSDATSGINASCTVNRATATLNGGTLTEGGLNCGQSILYTVTCLDRAGNSGSGSSTFTTNGCGGSGGGGGGGDSPSLAPSTPSLGRTFNDNSVELSSIGSVSRSVAADDTIVVKVNNEDHSVKINSLTSTSATITISSTPQQATLNVGETKKFELSDDSYYDTSVTLSSISGGNASIIITAIHELIQQAGSEGGSADVASTSGGMGRGVWIPLIIVILVVCCAAYYFLYVKRKPNYD